MKKKHLIAAAAGMVVALALFTGSAQAADDEPSYRFRLVNNHVNTVVYIRCGLSGEWHRVAIGHSRDVACKNEVAQTKLEGKKGIDQINDCSADRPVLRIEYKAYYIGLSLKQGLIVGCRAS